MHLLMGDKVRCTTLLCNREERVLVVGTDVPAGVTIQYVHRACDGGSIAVYAGDGSCVHEYNCAADSSGLDIDVGGGFAITSECSSIQVSNTLQVYYVSHITVGTMVNRAKNLYMLLDDIGKTDLDVIGMQQVINLYFEHRKSGGATASSVLGTGTLGSMVLGG